MTVLSALEGGILMHVHGHLELVWMMGVDGFYRYREARRIYLHAPRKNRTMSHTYLLAKLFFSALGQSKRKGLQQKMYVSFQTANGSAWRRMPSLWRASREMLEM